MVLEDRKISGNDAKRLLLPSNPDLEGKSTLAILDAVVDALAAEGVLVVLDNHMSDGDWCCSDNDGNGLWYNERYDES